MPAGRPKLFTNKEEIEDIADKYFANTPKGEYTISGLALELGMSRETLCQYAKDGEFSDTIRKYKQMVESDYEYTLRKRGNAGDIFGLKNFGWKDERSVQQESKVEVTGNLSGLSNEELNKLAEQYKIAE